MGIYFLDMSAIVKYSPNFVCADKRLVEFACAEGLAADNPENHPFLAEGE